MVWLFNNPLESLLLAILIGAFIFGCTKIFPKILRAKEKETIASFDKASPHDLAKPLGADAYFDTSSKVYAYETNGKFQSLESGWSYGNMEDFDFKKAAPKLKDDSLGEDATIFQKEGEARGMLS
jgi:hypothetical protein